MGRTIGIDLGTSYSCVAYMEGDTPVVIPNAEGGRTTPSMVALNDKATLLVGNLAKRQAITNAENTVFAVKRLIGRKYDSPEVTQTAKIVSYRIIPVDNGDAWVEIGGKKISPSEVSAYILARMKEYAEDFLSEKIEDAVVTVPAYFNDSQRQATKDAGRIAGLNVLRIINEPTAASLAYGLNKDQNMRIAVFDLGGGTFDISILELNEGVFEVLATNGNTFLGGEDFDRILSGWLVEDFKQQSGIDIHGDKMAMQRLKDAAEKAKMELSTLKETEVNLPFIAADASGPKHLTKTITRSQLESLVAELLDKLVEPCELALKDASLKKGDIDSVILVGGMTRMPAVVKKAEEIFSMPPVKEVNPDEVVAMGAAIQGAVLKGTVKDVVLLDVTPLSLGVETQGGVFTKILPRNTTIPTKKTMTFSTTEDDQDFVNIHVLQGERELAKDNQSLAEFQLIGIPPAPRGVPQIEVTFDIDANGIMHVRAKDRGTGKEQKIKITASSGLSEEQINGIISDAKQHEEDDRKRKRLVDLRNKADGLLYATTRSLGEYKGLLSKEDYDNIVVAMDDLKGKRDTDDIEVLEGTLNTLSTFSHRIAEILYQKAESEEKKT
ncbi:MAG: molecular chaperone DnaK [Deltaproteobacteria bacterium]|nr:molecular chaperone DnaK [Deltaproteobacteria bacterium]MCL5277150.1 molecular chaperone DnaK [Deltaproteobacteria bacterium]